MLTFTSEYFICNSFFCQEIDSWRQFLLRLLLDPGNKTNSISYKGMLIIQLSVAGDYSSRDIKYLWSTLKCGGEA